MKDRRVAFVFWLFVCLASAATVYFLVLSIFHEVPKPSGMSASVAPEPAAAAMGAAGAPAMKPAPQPKTYEVVPDTTTAVSEKAATAIRITLKNGRNIVADYCRERGRKLLCEKTGGLFEIDKQEIAAMKEIVAPVMYFETPSAPSRDAAEKTAAAAAPAGAGGQARGAQAAAPGELNKRLDEIEKRRADLNTEGEQIAQEREKLRADIQALGMTKSRTIADEYQRRVNELDDRIKGHNERVDSLNKEINAISGDLKK